MDTTLTSEPRTLGLVLLATRLVFGLLFAAHGAQKLFGWFQGYGLRATGEFFAETGFRPGETFAKVAGAAEVTSGLLIALGFLVPVGSALLLSVMVVAIVAVHWGHGLLTSSNGLELPLLYVTAAVCLALVGPGPYALDEVLGLSPTWTSGVTWGVLVIGAAGGLGNLMLRRRPGLRQRI
jgi:putative oxidoreductase